jgi:hypothetical protein
LATTKQTNRTTADNVAEPIGEYADRRGVGHVVTVTLNQHGAWEVRDSTPTQRRIVETLNDVQDTLEQAICVAIDYHRERGRGR